MPLASAISVSRSSGPAARSGLPLRTAASMSSASTQVGEPEPVRVLGGPLGGGERLLVAAEAVVEHRAAPVGGGEPEPFAAAQHVLPAGLDQRQRPRPPGRARRPARSAPRRLSWLPVASTTASASAASDVGRRELAGEELDAEAVVEGDGQQRERAGPAGELDLARGELVPAPRRRPGRGRCGRRARASAAPPPRRAARPGTRAAPRFSAGAPAA